jgi:hypothetical protein
MNKRYINYLIKELRSDRAIVRNFWKNYPEGKKCKDTVAEYKLQLEIIKALQSLKEKK